MTLRSITVLLLLLTPGVVCAQSAPEPSSSILAAPEDELPPIPRRQDPAAMALFAGGSLTVSGVMFGGAIAMGINARELDVQSGSAIVGIGLMSAVLMVASSVGLALGITGRYEELSTSPAWAWVGAALAVLAAGFALAAVADGAMNGASERTGWLMLGGTVSTIAAPLVFNIGTSMFE